MTVPASGRDEPARHEIYCRAELYDAAFSWDTSAEASFVERAVRRERPDARRLIEPFCGTGRLLRPLADRGFDVEGFDQEPAMLAIARRHAPHARLSLADGATWMPDGVFDGAYALIDSFRHLSLEGAAHLLAALASGLRSGAALVLGLELREAGPETGRREPEETWEGTRGGLRVRCTWRGLGRTGPRRDASETVVKVLAGARSEELRCRFEQTTWTYPELEAALALAGFDVAGSFDRRYDFDRPLAHPVGGVVLACRRR